jgi:hypothetical protein
MHQGKMAKTMSKRPTDITIATSSPAPSILLLRRRRAARG